MPNHDIAFAAVMAALGGLIAAGTVVVILAII